MLLLRNIYTTKHLAIAGRVAMPPNHSAANGATSVSNPGPVPVAEVGPHPSHIQVAKPFLFQQQLQSQLVAIGTNPTREDIVRLHGVQWINEVRTALQLYVWDV